MKQQQKLKKAKKSKTKKTIPTYVAFVKRHHQTITNIAVLILITIFLLTYFKPSLLFLDTTTSGGDMASHFHPAKHLKEELLPKARIAGWFPGAYMGMPLFQFYFPLPFMLMVFLSFIIPLTISFKIVTVLGIFGLPLAVFFCFKLMKHDFPTPIIASIASLLFLFNEGNSMWGGNILSTLAGEFSYSISLSLSILFIGLLYKGIEERRYLLINAVMVFLIGITHVYTLLLVILVSTMFLFINFKQNIKYLAKMYFLGFLLLSAWLLPLLAKLEFTTSYNLAWHIKSIWDIFPMIMLPIFILALLQAYLLFRKNKQERIKTFYFVIPVIASAIFFFLATKIGVVDIRFVPFVQLFLVLLGAEAIGFSIRKLRAKWIIAIVLLLITVLGVSQNTSKASQWIKWNYEGFEKKGTWKTFSGINEFLRGDMSQPRVVYEHSSTHNRFGTTRAFESLPLFSGRSTLEGVYMQSSQTAPFSFYIQSEISEQQSCPFPTFSCSQTDIDSALRHLKIFNVGHIIAVTDKIKQGLRNRTELVYKDNDYEIFQIESSGYVAVPEYWPEFVSSKNRDLKSYLWFIRDEEVPLVFADKIKKQDQSYVKKGRQRIDKKCNVISNLKNDEITFHTSCIGLPHIIRVSYFPNWKVEGAKNVYHVTPSFMLVFPEQEDVRIYYGNTFSDVFGLILMIVGVVILVLCFVFSNNKKLIKKINRRIKWVDGLIGFLYTKKTLILILLIISGAVLVIVNSVKTDIERDKLNIDIAMQTKRYKQCQNAGSLKDECYIEVAKLTDDSNLCVAKVSNRNKDRCFSEMAILLKDQNMCETRVKDAELKLKCLEGISGW